MGRWTVLLCDDDSHFRRQFRLVADEHFRVRTASSAAEAERMLDEEPPDALLLDIDLGRGESGLEFLERLRKADPDLPVVMVTAADVLDVGIEAMKRGADDYLTKDLSVVLLKEKIRHLLELTGWKLHGRRLQADALGRLIGESPEMVRVREEIERFGPHVDMAVLIRGETGAGKGLVARALHAAGPRAGEKFVPCNCAESTDDLFDSDLFGHEKGAFTGAQDKRRGLLEQAHGGTLFLDEVGKMPMTRQAKLLGVMEESTFRRLGGTEPFDCDVRWISASNEDLEAAMQVGEFRKDLYHRLGYELWIPPLRERRDDIPRLVDHFMKQFAGEDESVPRNCSDDALEVLCNHSWPGNVRELRQVLRASTILSGEGPIPASTILDLITRRGSITDSATESDLFETGTVKEAVSRFRRRFVRRVLDRNGGNKSQAAQVLGCDRKTLAEYLKG